MAIDDNTTYGLTGAQIKELPEKINAVKGQARELTADDYDYPTDNPTSIAAWLLAPGLYTAAESVRISICAGATLTISAKKNFIVLNGPGTSNKTIVDLSNRDGLNMGITMYYTTTDGSCVGTYMSFLTRDDVVDNLNSISATNPLSANQGRLLNDKIQPLQALATYSTTETRTGATWIDSSPIYKKTVYTGALPNNDSITVALGITNLDKIIDFTGVYTNSSGNTIPLNLPAHPGATTSFIRTSVSSSGIYIYCGDDRSDYSGYITLYYTKSS